MQIVQSKSISEIVNSTNTFTKEVFAANRELIKSLRAEKKAVLSSLDSAGILLIVAKAQAAGFTLTNTKQTEGKRIDKLQLDFTRKTSQTESEMIQKQIEKLTMKLNSIAA